MLVSHVSVGPTLAERFVSALRLPYPVGCAFIGLVIFGLPVNLLREYLKTFDLAIAVASVIPKDPVTLIVFLSVVPFLPAYVFYATRRMRMRVIVAEQSMTLLMSTELFQRLFGSISSRKPQLAIWLIIAITTSGLPGYLRTGPPTIPDLIAGVLFSTIFSLGVSTLVWTYFASLRGIHRMGNAPLKLRPHYEDGFFGLRPVGSLALSLAGSYFVLPGVLVVVVLFSPGEPVIYTFVSFFIILGLLMFFLPLLTLHRAMLEQRAAERNRIAREIAGIVQDSQVTGSTVEVTQILILDLMERKLSAVHTWPFDLNILGKLTIIVISVTAALLARLIAAALRI